MKSSKQAEAFIGRASSKENKNIYQISREEQHLTRAQASEKLEWISASRIEKIESDRSPVTPEEVLAMSEVYNKRELCNHFCSTECPIGKKYVPQISKKSLSEITLELLNLINKLESEKDRLIEITSDGVIHDDEIKDFVTINSQLKHISMNVESLKLWFEDTIASGNVNREILASVIEELGEKL